MARPRQLELISAPRDSLALEAAALRRGFSLIAGIDEAGRGSIAGPVVAAAVVLPAGYRHAGIRDSKLLDPGTREVLLVEIERAASGIGVGVVGSAEIDSTNILVATLAAMRLAVEALSPRPDFLLVDGLDEVPIPIAQRPVVKGDRKSLTIAAASIVAKVTRDRLMTASHGLYPQYGFDVHKGYGTAEHLERVRLHGPCPIHRKTFRGVREHAGGH